MKNNLSKTIQLTTCSEKPPVLIAHHKYSKESAEVLEISIEKGNVKVCPDRPALKWDQTEIWPFKDISLGFKYK